MIKESDIMSLEAFSQIRKEKQKEIMVLKKNRRVHVGEYVTLYFENYETMWWQIHEMLRIEKGGAEQLQDELQAYIPLIPKNNELIFTLMVEIDDPMVRLKQLYALKDIENSVKLCFFDHQISSHSLEEEDRTTQDGKTSSIHFLKWTLTNSQILDFKKKEAQIRIVISHPHYKAESLLSLENYNSLSKDLKEN